MRESILKGQIKILELWVAAGKTSARAKEILQIAEDRGIPVKFKERVVLGQSLPGIAHQGIVAMAEGFTYVDFNTLMDMSFDAQEASLLLAADHITDEGNLGALIRTAAFFRSHGLILPKDRSAKVTEKVRKRSAGNYVHLPITRVVNLGRALDVLDRKGFWIIGAAGEGSETIYQFDWKRDLVLVLGSEERGLSRLVRSRCHQLVSIPSYGQVESLNVAVASGIILSEIVRQRRFAG
ncbi:MAG: 23S rRNA (guanosine(2251)-2'-O)-methyltransferase RlmB [Desulfobacteraceae bacterium]|nr:23S rRNA (guanosine(2251)-2'-O)-methyltransferase RlmB [Desulfobacteraceae bacterium]